MAERSPPASSLEGTTLDKEMSIGDPSISKPHTRQNEAPRKPTAPLPDHSTAGAPQTVQAQNDELESILSVVERLETVKASAVGLSETNDADVLSGRGGGTNLHPGNRYFRQLIVSHSNSYDNATKSKKPLVARDVVQQIRRRGGRFLRKDSKDGLFYEIGDDLAREKASQAFRHRTFELRKQKGPDKETAGPDTTRQSQPVKRMRAISTNQQHASDQEGGDVSKKQRNDVVVAVAYPSRDGHSVDRMEKNDKEESSSTKGIDESWKIDAGRIRQIGKEEFTIPEGRALDSDAPERQPPPPPPWPDVDAFPSFLHNSTTGNMSQLLNGISSHSRFLTMLPRMAPVSASGSFFGGSSSDWDPRYSTALATRASSASSLSSSELNRSSCPSVAGRPEELNQRNDARRISTNSLATYPNTLEARVPSMAVDHPHLNIQKSALDDGTSRALQSSLRRTLLRPQDSSSAGGLGVLPASSPDTRFLPRGFQSPWSLLAPLSNQQLVQPSFGVTSMPSSMQTAAVDEYERSLLAAEYVLLRRIQQERATLLGRLAQEQQQQQQEQKEQEQAKGPQNYPKHQGFG